MPHFTPGPWRQNSVPGRILSADTSHVCDCTFDLLDGDMQANARLIAAAPDLLQALRDIVDAFDFEPDGKLTLHDKQLGWESTLLTDARSAIAKAEGRP